ncbi:MAG: hypothetical protein F6K17_04595 [Okeania sp. SIO3C4]|nr:hypothetical protein [Okeania sp. SIO3B3]NER01965.1 hypothetical protein [Okeania sp. SIO3C4]
MKKAAGAEGRRENCLWIVNERPLPVLYHFEKRMLQNSSYRQQGTGNRQQRFVANIYQNNMGRATPPFKAKYFWSFSQIPVTKITSVRGNGRSPLPTSDF